MDLSMDDFDIASIEREIDRERDNDTNSLSSSLSPSDSLVDVGISPLAFLYFRLAPDAAATGVEESSFGFSAVAFLGGVFMSA